MKKNIETITLKIDKEQESEFEKLSNILKMMNIDYDIDYGDPTRENQKKLIIEYDHYELYKKLHRSFGRKRKRINRNYFSVKDAEYFIKNKGAEWLANELGISRATLFRRLKKAREEGSSYIY